MAIVPPGALDPPHPPDFAWDEPNYLGYCYFLPAELHDRLLRLTHNANLALAAGSAAWILARFAPFDADPEARDFVAAVWAEMTDDWHCDRHYPSDDDWRGPVRGPMVVAMTILYDAVAGRGDNPDLADRSTWMHNFAQHVVQPLGPYLEWFEGVVGRLEAEHSWRAEGDPKPNLFDEGFPQGEPVPPEALMLDRPYNSTEARSLVERFVERERRNGNPFVLDAEEFEGQADDGGPH